MPSTFDHTQPNLIANSTRTLAYGPVLAATTVVVFSGTCTNIDSTGLAQHWITIESYNGTTYTPHLFRIPIPYGSASKVPKIVLLPGESLYITADANNTVAVRLELLVRT